MGIFRVYRIVGEKNGNSLGSWVSKVVEFYEPVSRFEP